jgi:hypothetical protein
MSTNRRYVKPTGEKSKWGVMYGLMYLHHVCRTTRCSDAKLLDEYINTQRTQHITQIGLYPESSCQQSFDRYTDRLELPLDN